MTVREPVNYIDETASIGTLVRVWWFARVLQDVVLGNGVQVGSGAEIGRGSTVGVGSRISAGVFLPPHSTIGKYVFIGPNTTFTDDRFPKVPMASDPPYQAMPPVIEDYAAIGAGVVILPGVTIGHHALVGAGSIITKDVAPYTIVRGLPSTTVTMRPHEDGVSAARVLP